MADVREATLAADWLGASRRAAEALHGILADAPTTAERVRETGARGRGRRPHAVIDADAEDAVFGELEALHDDGAALHGGQRGARARRLRLARRARRHRPDRRLHERQARAAAPLDLDRGRRRADDGRRRVRLRLRLRAGGGVDRAPRRGRLPRRRAAGPGAPRAAVGATGAWSCSASSPPTRAGSRGAGRGAGRAPRTGCGRIGTIAVTLCQVAAARLDGMVTLRRSRAVDAAAGQLIVREAGGPSPSPPATSRSARRWTSIAASPVVAARTRARARASWPRGPPPR